jgi:uncharacterized protein (DUF2062 family)
MCDSREWRLPVAMRKVSGNPTFRERRFTEAYPTHRLMLSRPSACMLVEQLSLELPMLDLRRLYSTFYLVLSIGVTWAALSQDRVNYPSWRPSVQRSSMHSTMP